MKKLIAFSTLLLFVFAAKAQTDSTAEKKEVVETYPYCIGGEAMRQKTISDNLVYPESAVKAKKQGTVTVEFIVEPDSTITNVKTLSTFDEDCAREAERLAALVKWAPATQNGVPVRVKVRMPIKFRLP